MKHLSDEQLTMAYYGDEDQQARAHLAECSECRVAFERLQRLLNELADYPAPERAASWEAEVWARLAPKLPARQERGEWFRWWMLAPALAGLLVVAFIGGMLMQRQRDVASGFSMTARQRALLAVMGDHLDRSEIVLAEVVNAAPGAADLDSERARARDLLADNRLIRQAARRDGDFRDAAVLDELERVLMDIAHAPADSSATDVEALQRRIENEGLLFKIRVVRSNIQKKEQNKGQPL